MPPYFCKSAAGCCIIYSDLFKRCMHFCCRCHNTGFVLAIAAQWETYADRQKIGLLYHIGMVQWDYADIDYWHTSPADHTPAAIRL